MQAHCTLRLLPISATAKERLGLETVMLSYAISDERIHAPDEFSGCRRSTRAWRNWRRCNQAARPITLKGSGRLVSDN
jgi:hypothetical protein